MKGKISEIFESIQGEGLYFGERQLFIRFSGCDINCKFCDTPTDKFFELEPQELLSKIKQYDNNYHSISFTGGEPLLQKDFLKEVLKLTAKENYRHYLETNGILPAALEEVIDYIDIVAMDLKLPSSTFQGDFWERHERFLSVASCKEVFLKTVICLTTEEADLRKGLAMINRINHCPVLVLQPNSFEEGRALWEKLMKFQDISREEGITSCIIPQMHKTWKIN
jgi:organic radical activating enzyme